MRRFALLIVVALVAAACTSAGGDAASDTSVLIPETTAAGDPATSEGDTTTTVVDGRSYAGTEPAPEFPDGLTWINTGRDVSLAELRGKVVLLDFWTYGCINCIHVIPDIERLEEEFADELVVIGVHSAKFDNESDTDQIRQVVVRYDLEHPVVNDADFAVWRSWGVNAWPTLILVDPAGNVVGGMSGEGVYEVFQPVIASLIAEFDGLGLLDRTPVDFTLERDGVADSVLSFPGKVLVDGGRLFVADTNHHRIVVADVSTGEVLDVAGSGARGYRDGGFAEARFDGPQGMALSPDGSTLYVADQGNHTLRALDLEARTVTTFAGTGEQASTYPPRPGAIDEVELSSPWDVAVDGSQVYVAMAGSHQIWGLDTVTGFAGPIAGSGAEGVVDGPAASAQLAQPSGLALDGRGRVYFADSESSTIRWVEPFASTTGLLAGSGNGLFDFGADDGVGTDARFQHPLGVAFDDGVLYVADTYNSALRVIDPDTGAVTTLAGGEPGWADGAEPRFDEPGGIDIADGLLYVADTNNHAVRIVDPDTGSAETLVLFGIERFEPVDDDYTGTVVTMEPVTLAPGEGTLSVDVVLPDGYKVNSLAPTSIAWLVSGDAVTPAPGADRSEPGMAFPQNSPATFVDGSGTVTADLTVYWCTADNEELCFIEQVRLVQPVEVVPGGAGELRLVHSITLPPGL
jgi:DNA-binding beta-propeller fold protein YncE